MMLFFFFNDTATTEIYTLSLHDALPISTRQERAGEGARAVPFPGARRSRLRHAPLPRDASAARRVALDRKSTRLNSSHGYISYAVFCLKKNSVIDRFERR